MAGYNESHFERAIQSGLSDRLGLPKKAIFVASVSGIGQDLSIFIVLMRPLGLIATDTMRDVIASLQSLVQGDGHRAQIYEGRDPKGIADIRISSTTGTKQ